MPQNHLGLRLILECLNVTTPSDYQRARKILRTETRKTRKKRPGFAQIDFRFRDEDGRPVDDYAFKLGALVDGKRKPSKTVVNLHKNKIDTNHMTAFIRLKDLEPKYEYFIEVDTTSHSDLYRYAPDPFSIQAPKRRITEIVVEDQTTQIDLVLAREPVRNLFRFHHGDDPDLHVRWNRKGEIKKRRLNHK